VTGAPVSGMVVGMNPSDHAKQSFKSGGVFKGASLKFWNETNWLRIIGFSLLFLLPIGLHSFARDVSARKSHLLYSAFVGGTRIQVFISDKPFFPEKHRTTLKKYDESSAKVLPATVDGRPVRGSDNRLPKTGCSQLATLYVMFGKRRVNVPERLLSNVFHPSLGLAEFDSRYGDTIVSVSADGKSVLISLGVGEGGGVDILTYCIDIGGTCTETEPSRIAS